MSKTATVHKLPSIAQQQATKAIDLKRQITALEAQLAPLADFFRIDAGGETKTIVVEGQGKVCVSKPVLPSDTPVLQLNADVFEALSEPVRKMIFETGAVTRGVKHSNGSVAKVTISPNV